MARALILPALVALACAPTLADAQLAVGQYAQMTIHQRIIIRLPRLSAPEELAPDMPPPEKWEERKAAQCVPLNMIAGAAFSREKSVDLVIADGGRLRALLDDDCPTIGFYSGIYLKPTADGMVCARRDNLRSRSGDACRIKAFKRLRLRR